MLTHSDHLYVDVIVDEANDLTTFMNHGQGVPIPDPTKERLRRFGYVFDDKVSVYQSLCKHLLTRLDGRPHCG